MWDWKVPYSLIYIYIQTLSQTQRQKKNTDSQIETLSQTITQNHGDINFHLHPITHKNTQSQTPTDTHRYTHSHFRAFLMQFWFVWLRRAVHTFFFYKKPHNSNCLQSFLYSNRALKFSYGFLNFSWLFRSFGFLRFKGADWFTGRQKNHDPVEKPAEKSHDPVGKSAKQSHDPVWNLGKKSTIFKWILIDKSHDPIGKPPEKVMTPSENRCSRETGLP